MSTLADDFETYLREQGRSPQTIRAYLSDLAAFEAWFTRTNDGEELCLEHITSLDVQQYRQHLLDTEAKPATVNRRLAGLRALGRWAEEERKLDNFARRLKCARTMPYRPKALSRNELNRLIREVLKANHTRDLAVVLLLAQVGLRVGEVARLEVKDIDLGERKGIVTIRAGKGAKYREVPLNKDVRAALRAWLDERPADAGEALFVGQRGEPLGASGITYLVRKYAKAARLNSVSPHTLRHTFATQLLDASGHDLRLVQHLLGHSRIETTARYLKPSAEAALEALEKLSVGVGEE
ncbi:MAG: tyrosine-type recombinase/integrase [Chloroflexi bacterium]|nr:tyrosine-type recombinase/integrase [Chloroflexota bacterium]